ncbi:MAG TPA: DUF4097 family beta strand repeat-containing protein [Gemmatimonadales bacterium]|nr:DUF4097 family beta strand repeat-containing protein [Gemmatimonadales bacterium]
MFASLALLASIAMPQADTTFAVERSQRLEVSAHSGAIIIRAWNRNAVRVKAELGPRARLTVDQSSATVSVHTRGARSGPADYDITVPAWMALSLHGVNTSITVDAVQAAIRAETVNGDIAVKGGEGLVALSTVEGAVTLEGAKGRIDVESVNADVTVQNSDGEVRAETVNGGITLAGVRADAVDATTVNGDVIYDGPVRLAGRYRLVTHNGDVTITIPPGTDARVSVSTFQGDFESDFPVTLTERRGKRFDFTVGRGGAAVDLESFQGTIRLVRPGARPRPSSPPDDDE